MTFFLVEEDSIDKGIRIGFFSGQKKLGNFFMSKGRSSDDDDEDKDIDDDDDNDNRPVCVQCRAYG